MPAKQKLSPDQWDECRNRWEGDPREGYGWLVTEMSLPLTADAIRLHARKNGWSKSEVRQGNVQQGHDRAAPKTSEAMIGEGKIGEGKIGRPKVGEGKIGRPKVGGKMAIIEEPAIKHLPERRSRGRPSVYREEYAEQAYKLCLLGATDAELADFFRVVEETINNWKHDYPEFLKSIKMGKTSADAEVAESLYKRALGYSHPDVYVSSFKGEITVTDIVKHYPPDTGAAFIWLKNRQPQKWKDKIELKEDINLNVFPSKEVLNQLFEESLKRSTEKAAMLAGRRERLGILINAENYD
ncbi:conserved hypothetical protein [Gammaproteobacteria bacterium]